MGIFKKIGKYKSKAEAKYLEMQESKLKRMTARQKIYTKIDKIKATKIKGQTAITKQKAIMAKHKKALMKGNTTPGMNYDPLNVMSQKPRRKKEKRDLFDLGF